MPLHESADAVFGRHPFPESVTRSGIRHECEPRGRPARCSPQRRSYFSAGCCLARIGTSSLRGASAAKTEPTRLPMPGMTTSRPRSIPSTASLRDAVGVDPEELGQGVLGVVVAETGPLAESGVHRAGAQGGGGDAGAAELAGETLGVGQHERLGRRVAGLSRQRLEGRGRGHVQHRAASARDHPGQEPAAQIGDRHDVDLQHADLGRGVGRRDRAHRREAGVVDQDLRGEAELGDAVGQGGPCRAVDEVAGQHVRLRAQLRRQRIELVLRAGHQRHLVAAPGQDRRDLEPDPARCPGDDGRALQSAHARRLAAEACRNAA